MKLALLAALAMVALDVPGCSSKSAEDKPAPAAAPAPEATRPAEPPSPVKPARPAAVGAVANAPPGFPRECVAYAELIDKLKDCDRLGGARDGLTQGYDNVRSAWSMVPAERRSEIAGQCKTQADSLRNAAAAACGW